MNCPECGHSSEKHKKNGCYHGWGVEDTPSCFCMKTPDQIEIAALRAENARLRAALGDIRSAAKSGMGEWSSVEPPFLPADLEVMYDIIEHCDEALKDQAE